MFGSHGEQELGAVPGTAHPSQHSAHALVTSQSTAPGLQLGAVAEVMNCPAGDMQLHTPKDVHQSRYNSQLQKCDSKDVYMHVADGEVPNNMGI